MSLLHVLPQETVKIHCRCFGLLVPAVVLPGLTFAAVVRLGSSWECRRHDVCWKGSGGCSSSLICGRIWCPQNGCGLFAWHISEQKALGTKLVYFWKHSGRLCKHSAKLIAETGGLNAGQLWLQPLPQAQLWLESLVGAVVAVPAVLEQFGLHRLHCHWWDQHLN